MTESKKPLESTSAETTVEIISIALQAVPYAGGVLSGTAAFFLERRKNERLNRFLLKLAEELKQINDRVNSDFVRSDEFRDLTEDIFSKAAETRQQEKLDALRAVFINTVLSDNPKYDEVEEITNLISKWQPRHLILLKVLLDPTTANDQRGKPIVEDSDGSLNLFAVLEKLLPDWEEDQVFRTLRDLEDDRVFEMPSQLTITRNFFLDREHITPFGHKVAKFINPLG